MRSQNGRYQSQLLNFLNQQTQKLKDQTGLMFRHLKLAAVTGAQIVLYPIYALFQATRMADRQLRQAANRALAYLLPSQPQPAVDLAIQNVMSIVPTENLDSNHLDKKLEISAIATDLQTRQLYLVTAQNQPIELSEAQQQNLQQRIVVELAQYWYLWRKYQQRQARLQFAQTTHSQTATQPALQLSTRQLLTRTLTIRDRPNLIAPVRIFYQLMAWMQQGPIAHQLNLFEETAIVSQPSREWFVPQLHQLPQISAPSNAQILKSAAAIDWEHFNWQDFWQTLPAVDGVPNLIRSAVSYFFGQRYQSLQESEPQVLDDPWAREIRVEASILTTDNLDIGLDIGRAEQVVAEFVDPTEFIDPIVLGGVATAASLPVQPNAPALPNRSLRQKLGGLVKQVTSHLTRPKSRFQVPTLVSLPQQALAAETTTAGSSLTWENGFSSDPTTTWIETPAEHMGYIKHPLERILGWLDRGLVWLENQLGHLWQLGAKVWKERGHWLRFFKKN